MSEETKIISQKIKALRLKAGWSQTKLAKRIKVSGPAICLIEKGDRYPSAKVSKKIAAAFKISLEELLNLEEIKSLDRESLVFYRKYGYIEKLSDKDRRMVEALINRLKDG